MDLERIEGVEIDSDLNSVWEEMRRGKTSDDWILLEYSKTDEKEILVSKRGDGSLESGLKSLTNQIAFLLINSYKGISIEVMFPFDMMVLFVPERIKNEEKFRRSRACWHVTAVADQINLYDFFYQEVNDPKGLTSEVILESIQFNEVGKKAFGSNGEEKEEKKKLEASTETKKERRKSASRWRRSSMSSHHLTFHASRVLYESNLMKESRGRIIYSVKPRWHVFTADLKMSLYDKPYGKLKSSYQIKYSLVGKGIPPPPAGNKKRGSGGGGGGFLKKFGISGLKKKLKVEKRLSDTIDQKEKLGSCFYIQTLNGRTHQLMAEDISTCDIWLEVLVMTGCTRQDYFTDETGDIFEVDHKEEIEGEEDENNSSPDNLERNETEGENFHDNNIPSIVVSNDNNENLNQDGDHDAVQQQQQQQQEEVLEFIDLGVVDKRKMAPDFDERNLDMEGLLGETQSTSLSIKHVRFRPKRDKLIKNKLTVTDEPKPEKEKEVKVELVVEKVKEEESGDSMKNDEIQL